MLACGALDRMAAACALSTPVRTSRSRFDFQWIALLRDAFFKAKRRWQR